MQTLNPKAFRKPPTTKMIKYLCHCSNSNAHDICFVRLFLNEGSCVERILNSTKQNNPIIIQQYTTLEAFY